MIGLRIRKNFNVRIIFRNQNWLFNTSFYLFSTARRLFYNPQLCQDKDEEPILASTIVNKHKNRNKSYENITDRIKGVHNISQHTKLMQDFVKKDQPKTISKFEETKKDIQSNKESNSSHSNPVDFSDIEPILNKMPADLRNIPNAPIQGKIFYDLITSEESKEIDNMVPLQEIGTINRVVSKVESGRLGHQEQRMSFIGGQLDEYFEAAPEQAISPWHDVALTVKQENEPDYFDDSRLRLQMIVTMPKGSLYQNRIVKDERMNPIRHVILKTGQARMFNRSKSKFNIGVFPQTFQDQRYWCPVSLKYGNEDLLTVVDVCGSALPLSPAPVKLLGCLGVISPHDLETIQWVMLACSLNDPLSRKLKDIADVETWLPGRLEEIRDFFRNLPFDNSSSKLLPDVKENLFFDDGRFLNMKTAYFLLRRSNQIQYNLITRKITSPGPYYFHHPLVRNGEMLSRDELPTTSNIFDNTANLSLKDRLRKDQKNMDSKQAFYQLEYLKREQIISKQKLEYLMFELNKTAISNQRNLNFTRLGSKKASSISAPSLTQINVHKLSQIKQNLLKIEEANPLPNQIGLEHQFKDNEYQNEQNLQVLASRLEKLDKNVLSRQNTVDSLSKETQNEYRVGKNRTEAISQKNAKQENDLLKT